MRKTLTMILFLAATTVGAQVERDILEDLLRDFGEDAVPERGEVTSRVVDGAVLRGLDTLNGTVNVFTIAAGQTLGWERLELTLEACRVPAEGEQPDGYAFLRIRDLREEDPRFVGWMIASSPALNALDHPRYDIWVDRCYEGEPPVIENLEEGGESVDDEPELLPAPQDSLTPAEEGEDG